MNLVAVLALIAANEGACSGDLVRQVMERFECSKRTATDAVSILRKAGCVESIPPHGRSASAPVLPHSSRVAVPGRSLRRDAVAARTAAVHDMRISPDTAQTGSVSHS